MPAFEQTATLSAQDFHATTGARRVVGGQIEYCHVVGHDPKYWAGTLTGDLMSSIVGTLEVGVITLKVNKVE